MKHYTYRGGYALVMVLFVAGIGLLFGAGALLLFRYQCQLRINRQHELEKVYAVRSALNYIRQNANLIDSGKLFSYHTESERNLDVVVEPAELFFPDRSFTRNIGGTTERHFAMEDGWFSMGCDKNPCSSCEEHYNREFNYEYGAIGVTNLVIQNQAAGYSQYGLVFADLAATNTVKWWINIGMRDVDGWLKEDYGMRYCFNALLYADGKSIKDTIRFCLVRDVTNQLNEVGSQHGWPLSKEGERALVFQISPLAGSNSKGTIQIFDYVYTNNLIVINEISRQTDCYTMCNMGMQIAGRSISSFYVDNINGNGDPQTGGYTFSEPKMLSDPVYAYFSEKVTLDDGKSYITYPGLKKEGERVVSAPALRAVFEVEATSDARTPGRPLGDSHIDFLTNFRVTPAYQYDVFLVRPDLIYHDLVTNRATVVQRTVDRGEGPHPITTFTTLTYDTHGTDNKGFRKDEREAEKRRSGQ